MCSSDLFVVVGAPATGRIRLEPSGFALVAVFWIVALDELIEIFALQRICFQGEVLVGPEVVNPELLGPRRLAGLLLVEEEDVCLNTLGLKQPCREAEQGVHVALVEKLTPDGLPGPTFEEDVVGNDDRRATVDLEQSLDVLEKVELLVRGRSPEIVALVGLSFFDGFTIIGHDCDATLLAEGRIG